MKERGLLPHQPFLSQYDIEKRFAVSMNLAKQALDHMERDGVIYRIHRKGTFVAPRARNRPILMTAHEGAESAWHPVIANTARLGFMQGLLDELETGSSPHFATFVSRARFQELRFDLAHVYRGLAAVVVFRDIDLLELARPVCAELAIPLAFFGSSLHLPRLGEVHRMIYREETAVDLAVAHLLESGRTRLACAWDPSSPLHVHRRDLFHQIMARRGLSPAPDMPKGPTPNSFAALDGAWPEIRRRVAGVDGVFAVDDNVATDFLNCLVRSGVDVPGQVALVGVNNYPTSFHAVVPVTTVDIPLRASGALLMNTPSS